MSELELILLLLIIFFLISLFVFKIMLLADRRGWLDWDNDFQ